MLVYSHAILVHLLWAMDNGSLCASHNSLTLLPRWSSILLKEKLKKTLPHTQTDLFACPHLVVVSVFGDFFA